MHSTSTNGKVLTINGRTYRTSPGLSESQIKAWEAGVRKKARDEKEKKDRTARRKKEQKEKKHRRNPPKAKTNWLGQPKKR